MIIVQGQFEACTIGLRIGKLGGKEAAGYEKLAWRFVAVLRNVGISDRGAGNGQRLVRVYSIKRMGRNQGWLKDGYDLWSGSVSTGADNFMPRPDVCLGRFLDRVAEPGEVAALNVWVLSELRQVIPKFNGGLLGGGSSGQVNLLGDSMEWFGTGHSELATLTSGLAALGVTRGERDLSGRWWVDGSDVYVRGYKGLVRRLVEKFVDAAGPREVSRRSTRRTR